METQNKQPYQVERLMLFKDERDEAGFFSNYF